LAHSSKLWEKKGCRVRADGTRGYVEELRARLGPVR